MPFVFLSPTVDRHNMATIRRRTTSTCKNLYGRVLTILCAIFDRTTMKISLYSVEFECAMYFCLAPPKSMFLWICIDFFDVFLNCFVPSFRTISHLPVPPRSRRHCRPGRGSRRSCGGGGVRCCALQRLPLPRQRPPWRCNILSVPSRSTSCRFTRL